MKKLFFIIAALLAASCGASKEGVTVFHAACFSSVIEETRGEAQKMLGIELRTEGGGSVAICRKIADLSRECDLVMLADNGLFKKLLPAQCGWRLEFTADELVLGVGSRAKKIDEAEKDWARALLDDSVRLGRVDETLSPAGYRALLAWKLKEKTGCEGLEEKLKAKCVKALEDVEQLAAMLKQGELDYGFMYRSTCVAGRVRFIKLDDAINLGSPGRDYSTAEVSFEKGGKTITVRGEPIIYALSIPRNAANAEKAFRLVKFLLADRKAVFTDSGFTLFKSRFFGNKADFERFSDFADYGGEF